MKIVQIIYNLSSGGGERFVVDTCNELAKNNENDVHLLTVNANTPSLCHYLDTLSPVVNHTEEDFYNTIAMKRTTQWKFV